MFINVSFQSANREATNPPNPEANSSASDSASASGSDDDDHIFGRVPNCNTH